MVSVSSALKLRAANQLNQVGYYSVNSAVEKYPVTTFVSRCTLMCMLHFASAGD